MAINKAVRYPDRWETATTSYPMGQPKNRTTETSKDGTYFEKDWLTDYEAFFGAAMNEAGYSPDGTVDSATSSQIFEAFIASREAENRLIGNQNFNVASETSTLPSDVPTTYSVGDEIAEGVFCVGSDLINATYENGVFDADSGSYMRQYEGDFTDDFYGVKLADNSISDVGVSIALVGGYTQVTVNMNFASAHKFVGLSAYRGTWPDINDYESELQYKIEAGLDDIETNKEDIATNAGNIVGVNLLSASQPIVQSVTGAALPSGTATDYADGDEIAFGYYADGAVTNLEVDGFSNLVLSNPATDTGKIYIECDIPTNKSITDLFGSVITGSVSGITTTSFTNAEPVTGLTLSLVGGKSRLTIDLSLFTGGAFAFGISEQSGGINIDNDNDISEKLIGGNGDVRNPFTILSSGGYSTGNYTVSGGYSFSDFELIKVFTAQSTDYEGGIVIEASKGAIESSLTSFAIRGIYQAGIWAQITATSSTTFSVTRGDTGIVREVVGYLKAGVE